MLKRIFLPVVFLMVTFIAFGQNNIAIYEDCNYSGKRYYLGVGSYKLYQMKMDNDQLSSLQIPWGLRVTLYEHDDFKGNSISFTGNVACLDEKWNDNTTSLVVESLNNSNYNPNDYVTFYNDCYSQGYSQSLRPGTYTGDKLGILKYNISSFTISGNLRVKVYTNNENAYGYSTYFDNSQSCLSNSYNDKIGSVVIEYRSGPTQNPNTGTTSNNFATIYTDCSYRGNSLRLVPGYYEGDKLGLFKYDISSIELPSNLIARVYVNDEYLSGNSYTLSQGSSCLPSNLNNRIGSLSIEQRYGGNSNSNNFPPNQPADQFVVVYSDANYKGFSANLLPGTYATMSHAGFSDDALSSLTVPPGYRVVLYEFENFKGKSYTITQSKPGFIISGWNDKTSSIAVYRQ